MPWSSESEFKKKKKDPSEWNYNAEKDSTPSYSDRQRKVYEEMEKGAKSGLTDKARQWFKDTFKGK